MDMPGRIGRTESSFTSLFNSLASSRTCTQSPNKIITRRRLQQKKRPPITMLDYLHGERGSTQSFQNAYVAPLVLIARDIGAASAHKNPRLISHFQKSTVAPLKKKKSKNKMSYGTKKEEEKNYVYELKVPNLVWNSSHAGRGIVSAS